MPKIDRRAIYERDQGICGICGEPVELGDFEVDHIRQRMVGGSDDPANLRTTHKQCNRARGTADMRAHGLGPGRPGYRPPGLLDVRLSPATCYYLRALLADLRLSKRDVIRLALCEAAARRKIPAYAPPAPESAAPADA